MTNFRAMIAVAASLAASQALAADGTLAPGKPAGVQQAARHSPNLLLIGGAAALVVGGVAIGLSQDSNAQCGAACTVTPATTT